MAEVLITLGVIGVVAAYTIPNIIEKHQKQVTVNRLKKAYTTFSNAIELSENENAPIDDWQYHLSSEDFASKYILPYLKGSILPNEKHRVNSLGDNTYSLLADYNEGYILPDGTWFHIVPSTYWGYPSCFIFVDLNGKKKPNIMGKDVFTFAISNLNFNGHRNFVMFSPNAWGKSTFTRDDLLNPAKTFAGVKATCAKTDNVYSGYSCGYLIQMDGWQIKDDYPW